MNPCALNRICGRAVNALPDSIQERTEQLTDILGVLEPRHPMRAKISSMLLHLQEQEKCQRQLALEFPTVVNPNPKTK